jgi:lysophospholipase L1-like esterase
MLSYFRWEAASLIGDLRNIKPITPVSSYIDAIKTMVSDCELAGATPVVLSPFIYGSRRTARKAASYVSALHELHSKDANMILVDCVSLLTKFQKKVILQHDGFHLSRLGHELVGRQIGEAISADLASKAPTVSNAVCEIPLASIAAAR